MRAHLGHGSRALFLCKNFPTETCRAVACPPAKTGILQQANSSFTEYRRNIGHFRRTEGACGSKRSSGRTAAAGSCEPTLGSVGLILYRVGSSVLHCHYWSPLSSGFCVAVSRFLRFVSQGRRPWITRIQILYLLYFHALIPIQPLRKRLDGKIWWCYLWLIGP